MTKAALLGKGDHYITDVALEQMGFKDGLLYFDGATWLCYVPETGLFEEMADAVYLFVDNALHGAEVVGEEEPFNASHRMCTAVEAKARKRCFLAASEDLKAPGIAFANGFLDASSGTLEPHSPKHMATTRVDIPYNPEATCPAWDSNMREVFAGAPDAAGTIRMLEEYFGLCLLGRATLLNHALFLLGESAANGKSTLIEVVTSLFPVGAVKEISPHKLSGNQAEYYMMSLKGVLLNVVPDMSRKDLYDLGDYKAIVGGDRITGRNPHGKPESFRPIAGHVNVMNALPNVGDTSGGFWRRAIAVNFPNSFRDSRRDVQRSKKLMLEREGILARLVERGLCALSRGALVIPEECSQLWKAWRDESNPVKVFLEDIAGTLELAFDGSIKRNLLYASYKGWCVENGRGALNSSNFGKALAAEGIRTKKDSAGTRWYQMQAEGDPDPWSN